MAAEEVLKELTRLEAQHKVVQTEELKQKQNTEIYNVKLIEASQTARDIMYTK